MAKKIAVSALNATTIDIINTIRANASAEYQSLVPAIAQEKDIPRVGEILYGYPALANQFITALVNRIAMVRVKSATFNNAYANLKKGYLEFGETVEEVFVGITKAREFSAEKAAGREFKRSMPDVKSAFHSMNWRVQYPITIQEEDLRMAFQSATGVQDLIAKVVNAVYTSAEFDEFLLCKYLLIKAISHGKMYPVAIGGDMKSAATAFRANSNKLTFMSKKYNAAGVTTTTPREDQIIFMDADYNARFDVENLSASFHMDKIDFMGRLYLIDDFTTFDNDRFSEIMEGSDQIELVTDDELALCADVKAILLDQEWFQIYDNLAKMTETYVASGMYWNYFYNTWKTVSSSPFSNAVVFVEGSAPTLPTSITVKVDSKDVGENATVINLSIDESDETLASTNVEFIQTQALTEDGIAVHPYGSIMVPSNKLTENITIVAKIGDKTYTATSAITANSATVGGTRTLQ